MLRRPFAIALLTLALSAPLFGEDQKPAQDGHTWIDPGWRRTTVKYAITFDEDGSSNSTFEFEILLTDAKGLKSVAQQIFVYDSYAQQLNLSDLATVKADGRVIPVDERAINDQPMFTDPSSPYFDEQRIRTVAYPDVAPGDKVRGRAIYASKHPLFPREFADYWAEPLDYPPEVVELTLSGPASRPLQVAARGVEHAEERIGDRIVHRVRFRQDNPTPLLDATDDFDTARRFEVSTFKDYAAFAAVLRERNAPMALPDEAVRRLSAEIVGDAANDRAKAERIYNWVARYIRYVGIGLEDGGFTSQPASAIVASRYGDCKAHVTILKSLLAAQGIEADFVTVNADSQYTLTSVATPNFNHAIAYLPQFDLYADPTSSIAAFGSLPANLYGKPVLNIDKGTVSTIPLARPEDFAIRDETAYTLSADGTRKAGSSFLGVGIAANVGRTVAQKLELSDHAYDARRLLREAGLDGTGGYAFPDPREPAGTFAISAPFEITRPVSLDRPTRIRLLALTDPRPSLWALISGNPPDRAFRCLSLDYEDKASLDIPAGTNLEEIPGSLAYAKNLGGKTAYGTVTGRVEITGNVVVEGRTVRAAGHIKASFDAPVCPREFAAEIKSALTYWDEFKRGAIGLTPRAVARVAQKGSRYDAGLRAYRSGDYETALQEWRPVAEQGDMDAQFYLGSMYASGKGVDPDERQAFEWYRKAAEQGHTLAESNLAYIYDMGLGVPKDDVQSLYWYRKAAEQGSDYAQYNLGWKYDHGEGTAQDHRQAVEWYGRAAEQSHVKAQVALGVKYERGEGTAQDYDRAAHWYRKAAEQGYSLGQLNLGLLYAYGRGVAQDYKVSAEWFRKAAQQGHATAQFNLGYSYESGLGVPQDRQQAINWYKSAARQGYSDAQARLNSLNPLGTLAGALKGLLGFGRQ